MSSRLSKIRSVHTYVMIRMVYFGWICRYRSRQYYCCEPDCIFLWFKAVHMTKITCQSMTILIPKGETVFKKLVKSTGPETEVWPICSGTRTVNWSEKPKKMEALCHLWECKLWKSTLWVVDSETNQLFDCTIGTTPGSIVEIVLFVSL